MCIQIIYMGIMSLQIWFKLQIDEMCEKNVVVLQIFPFNLKCKMGNVPQKMLLGQKTNLVYEYQEFLLQWLTWKYLFDDLLVQGVPQNMTITRQLQGRFLFFK